MLDRVVCRCLVGFAAACEESARLLGALGVAEHLVAVLRRPCTDAAPVPYAPQSKAQASANSAVNRTPRQTLAGRRCAFISVRLLVCCACSPRSLKASALLALGALAAFTAVAPCVRLAHDGHGINVLIELLPPSRSSDDEGAGGAVPTVLTEAVLGVLLSCASADPPAAGMIRASERSLRRQHPIPPRGTVPPRFARACTRT
jgi:hypothetical protein